MVALSCLATALPNEPGDQGCLRVCGFHTQCGACMGGQGTFGWEHVIVSTTTGVTSDTLGSHLELPEKTEAPPLPGPTPAWAPFHFLYLQLIDVTPVIPQETQRGREGTCGVWVAWTTREVQVWGYSGPKDCLTPHVRHFLQTWGVAGFGSLGTGGDSET